MSGSRRAQEDPGRASSRQHRGLPEKVYRDTTGRDRNPRSKPRYSDDDEKSDDRRREKKRRKRERERERSKEQELDTNAEAGPSNLNRYKSLDEERAKGRNVREAAEAGPLSLKSNVESRSSRRKRQRGKREDEYDDRSSKDGDQTADQLKQTFESNVDYIAFTFDESEKEEDEREKMPPAREWDKGKRRAVDAGSKRKAEEMEYDDSRYATKKQRVDATSRLAPWVDGLDLDSCANAAQVLHKEVEAFVDYVSPTPEEDELRGLTVALISKVVRQAFPDAQVLPFGSYETKLYLPLGDIDLVIQSDRMAYENKVTVLHSLAGLMRRNGVTDRVSIIAKAKVPIIKFITTHGRFPVDISINQVNGLGAVKMVKHYLVALPALRALVLIIKAFLSQRSMNEVFSGGLGSYSIVCMVVSFLQMQPKIRRGEIDPSRNLGVLVMEFFELYGCYFNYDKVGISLRDGGTYYNKRERGWWEYNKPHLLSIEDPSDMSNDISKGSYGIRNVRRTLAGAHGIMTSAAYMSAGIISARREGRSISLREGVTEPNDLSVLSKVLGLTQETINHRRLVNETYENGVLHRLVGVPRKVDPVRPESTSRDEDRFSQRPSASDRSHGAASIKNVHYVADSDEEAPSVRHDPREEEESRYTIDRREPPRKRRKVGKPVDERTYFTTDSEEDDHARYPVSEVDSLDEEERAYASLDDVRRGGNAQRNRSYWLSKGIGAGDDSS